MINMPEYNRNSRPPSRNFSRLSNAVLAMAEMGLAVYIDDSIFRVFLGYMIADNIVGTIIGEYHPVTRRIYHTLRHIKDRF